MAESESGGEYDSLIAEIEAEYQAKRQEKREKSVIYDGMSLDSDEEEDLDHYQQQTPFGQDYYQEELTRRNSKSVNDEITKIESKKRNQKKRLLGACLDSSDEEDCKIGKRNAAIFMSCRNKALYG